MIHQGAYGTAVQPAERTLRLADRPQATVPALQSLASGVLWLLASNVSYAACQWGALVALAKFGSAASLGHFGLALAVATPVVMVTGFALRAVQATDVQRRYAFSDYLSVRLLANVVAAAIIGAVALGGLDGAAAAILLPIGVAKLAEATSETCYGLAQRHDRMRLVALSKATRGALGLTALVAVVALDGTFAQGAWALAGTWTAFLLGIDLPAAGMLEPVFARPDRRRLWQLVRESAPLGAVNGVLAVTQSVPRYLLELRHGATAVGYFTAVSSLGPALDMLMGSVGHAAAPRLGWAASADGGRFRRLVMQLLGVATAASGALALVAALAGRQFLAMAYAADYADYRTALVLVIVAAGFTMINSMSFLALIAARRPRIQLAIQCLGLAVTAGCAAVLIPRFAVNGAATALALGGAVMTIVSACALLARRKERQGRDSLRRGM
jgi:O-antigen/teichoic acid export membrane protein